MDCGDGRFTRRWPRQRRWQPRQCRRYPSENRRPQACAGCRHRSSSLPARLPPLSSRTAATAAESMGLDKRHTARQCCRRGGNKVGATAGAHRVGIPTVRGRCSGDAAPPNTSPPLRVSEAQHPPETRHGVPLEVLRRRGVLRPTRRPSGSYSPCESARITPRRPHEQAAVLHARAAALSSQHYAWQLVTEGNATVYLVKLQQWTRTMRTSSLSALQQCS